MTKAELITDVVQRTGLPRKDAELALNGVLDAITGALARGEKVQLVNFGAFEVQQRRSRTGRNPSTGQEVEIPAGAVPQFRPGKSLRDAVKEET